MNIQDYIVVNPQKCLSLKELVEDINAIERVKMLLEERKEGSLGLIEEIKNEYINVEGVDTIYEVHFNLKTDMRKDMYPNGRNQIDVSEEGYKKLLENDGIEVAYFQKYKLKDEIIKKLEN